MLLWLEFNLLTWYFETLFLMVPCIKIHTPFLQSIFVNSYFWFHHLFQTAVFVPLNQISYLSEINQLGGTYSFITRHNP